ncbi:hypothetical protein SUDANB108_06792 [Streptomyces sp. enrichment culture]
MPPRHGRAGEGLDGATRGRAAGTRPRRRRGGGTHDRCADVGAPPLRHGRATGAGVAGSASTAPGARPRRPVGPGRPPRRSRCGTGRGPRPAPPGRPCRLGRGRPARSLDDHPARGSPTGRLTSSGAAGRPGVSEQPFLAGLSGGARSRAASARRSRFVAEERSRAALVQLGRDPPVHLRTRRRLTVEVVRSHAHPVTAALLAHSPSPPLPRVRSRNVPGDHVLPTHDQFHDRGTAEPPLSAGTRGTALTGRQIARTDFEHTDDKVWT